MLYLNNTAASSVGVVVEHRPARPVPRRKTLSFDVPGRTGRLVRELDAWENVTLVYDLAVIPLPGYTLGATCDLAVAWLTQPGPVRLYDDKDPAVYYLVSAPGGETLSPVVHSARRITIGFDADPRRYLLAGETAVPLVSSTAVSVSNPTPYAASPLIRVTGGASGTLTIGSRTLRFDSGEDLVIDCALQRSTSGVSVSADDNLWPVLAPGANTVQLTGTGLSAELEPRWYQL